MHGLRGDGQLTIVLHIDLLFLYELLATCKVPPRIKTVPPGRNSCKFFLELVLHMAIPTIVSRSQTLYLPRLGAPVIAASLSSVAARRPLIRWPRYWTLGFMKTLTKFNFLQNSGSPSLLAYQPNQ